MSRSRLWLERPDMERVEILNRMFVDRPALKAIVTGMDELRERYRSGGAAQVFTVTGEPGVGKSELLKNYRDGNPPIVEETATERRTRRPVCYVELPPNSSAATAATSILKELMGANIRTAASTRDLDLADQLKLHSVEILILDEFNHAAEKGADATRRVLGDWVKGLTKLTRIPFVLAGVPTVEELVNGHEQLRTIARTGARIPTYSYGTAKARKTFQAFLKDVDDRLPFDRRAGLSSPPLAAPLYRASAGNLRRLAFILQHAGTVAIKAKAPCIRTRDLRDACKTIGWEKKLSPDNPFQNISDVDGAEGLAA